MKKNSLIFLLATLLFVLGSLGPLASRAQDTKTSTGAKPSKSLKHQSAKKVVKKVTTPVSKVKSVEQNSGLQIKTAGTPPAGWTTYSSDKLGLKFQHPGTWIPNGTESNAIDRNGKVLMVTVSFIDAGSGSAFFIEYHLPPYGAELFSYTKTQFDSAQGMYATGAQELKVAGNKALVGFSTLSKDMRGNIVDPPLKIVSVSVLDKQQTGGFALTLKTPLQNSDAEVAKFKQLLSSIKFTK